MGFILFFKYLRCLIIKKDIKNTFSMDQKKIFYKALLERDSSFEGTFIVGVKTTGIFCRPTCSARKPKFENVEFFSSTKEALSKGYRACKICHPMERNGETPEYIHKLLQHLEDNPNIKLKDFDLRNFGIDPIKVRRWFLKNHGITFHMYQGMYRINEAFKKCKEGNNITQIAYDSGFESLSGFNETFKKITGITPKMSKEKQLINLTRLVTPLGTMIACASEKGICLLEFSDRKMLERELQLISKRFNASIVPSENSLFKQLRQQLDSYFEGTLKEFTVPLDWVGSDFQKEVWKVLLQIPYGKTSTYAIQAKRIGKPSSVRAVANANGMNMISILVPCHRVIGSDGSLTGYGGGLWRKKKLLELEAKGSLQLKLF